MKLPPITVCSEKLLFARTLIVIECALIARRDNVGDNAISLTEIAELAHAAITRDIDVCRHDEWLSAIETWEQKLIKWRVLDDANYAMLLESSLEVGA